MVRFTDSGLPRIRGGLLERFRFERFRRRHRPLGVPSIGVASGKGGTGKTFTTTNLAVLLAKRIGQVQIVDADLGLGNAHVHLGLRPLKNLQHYLDGEVSLDDLQLVSEHGVRLLPGGTGISRLSQLEGVELRRLSQDLVGTIGGSRAVFIDSAAGISPQALLFLRCTELVVLVVTPELPSLTDAYAVIKCLVLRQPECRFLVLVNRTDSRAQAREVFEKLSDVASRFLSIPLHYLGGVPEDRAVRASLGAKVPHVIRAPRSPASRALDKAARELTKCVSGIDLSGERRDFTERLLEQF